MTTLDGVNVQLVDGPLTQVMSNIDNLLVRQKLDVMAMCCPACQRRNHYKVKQAPSGFPDDSWDDEQFWSAPDLLVVQEESECCQRVCCGGYRAMKLHINTPNEIKVLEMDRPFKCTLFCCCTMLNRQELSIKSPNGTHMGKVEVDFKCSDFYCGKQYINVMDKHGDTRYYIKDDVCCNKNCGAPSCCCPVRHMPIMNSNKEVITGAALTNVWPGCNCRGVAGGATNDNYKLDFPANASAEDKALLLGGLFLVEYVLFERRNKDDNDLDN